MQREDPGRWIIWRDCAKRNAWRFNFLYSPILWNTVLLAKGGLYKILAWVVLIIVACMIFLLKLLFLKREVNYKKLLTIMVFFWYNIVFVDYKISSKINQFLSICGGGHFATCCQLKRTSQCRRAWVTTVMAHLYSGFGHVAFTSRALRHCGIIFSQQHVAK